MGGRSGNFVFCSCCGAAEGGDVLFGNMDQWVTREIKESGIIGGNTKKYMPLDLRKPL